jgi:hypothetical protein
MLRRFVTGAAERGEAVPCRTLPERKYDVEVLDDGDRQIFNALSTVTLVGKGARQRWFCTWSDGVGCAGGRSLVHPWQRRRKLRAGIEMDAGDVSVVVRQTRTRLSDVVRLRRWSVIEITNPADGERLTFSAVGWRNDVVGERNDGTVVAKLFSTSREIEIDDGVSGSEFRLLLVAIGSGTASRARRFGLAARSV